MNLLKFSGWKTYALCAALAGVGVAMAFGVHVPEWALTILGGGAGAAGRLAIQKAENAALVVADAFAALQAAAAAPQADTLPQAADSPTHGFRVDPMGQ